MNLVVAALYWSVLHKDAMKEHKNVPNVGWIRVIHLQAVHTIPGLCCLINSFKTRIVLTKDFGHIILWVSCIYTGLQVASVVILGNDSVHPAI